MKEIMIDLETLCLKNDPVVISVAAIQFSRDGIIKNSNVWYLDLNDSLRNGFRINKNTLIWWLQWPDLLKSQIDRNDSITVIDFLGQFKEWISVLGDKDEIIVWGDSAFDQNIIESMYDKYEIKCPIFFRNYRDVRTIKGLAKELELDIQIDSLKDHNPLNDALYNIKYLIEFFKKVKGIKLC